nr:uncharacterized protein LOC119181757 [Rhipicephalus microplus]
MIKRSSVEASRGNEQVTPEANGGHVHSHSSVNHDTIAGRAKNFPAFGTRASSCVAQSTTSAAWASTSSPAGKTGLGDPHRIVSLGHTELPHDVCVEYIRDLARYSYRRSSYDLFRHNCNHFSEDLSLFLTGNSIPMDIRELPDDFLSTPMGNMMHSFQHMSDEALKALEQHSVHEQQRNPQSPRPPQ